MFAALSYLRVAEFISMRHYSHWYYEDFIREEEPSFPSMALKTFSRHLFNACPLLQHWALDHDQAFQDFLDYKTSVPVCGVIMLDPTWTKVCVMRRELHYSI